MKLSEVIPLVYKKNWSYTNNYEVDIIFTGQAIIENNLTLPRDLNVHVKDVSLPDFQWEAISTWTMDRLRLANGKLQELKFSITFLDHNDLELWRTWARIWDLSSVNFPKDVMFDVKITKKSENYNDEKNVPILTLKNCLIENLGRFQYGNQDEAQIANFILSAKTAEYSFD